MKRKRIVCACFLMVLIFCSCQNSSQEISDNAAEEGSLELEKNIYNSLYEKEGTLEHAFAQYVDENPEKSNIFLNPASDECKKAYEEFKQSEYYQALSEEEKKKLE